MCLHCYSQTNCFVVSQNFSPAKHTRCFKLESKPGRLFTSRVSYPSKTSHFVMALTCKGLRTLLCINLSEKKYEQVSFSG